MKDWEIIADNLSEAGWSLGYVSAIDSNGRTIWIADAHRDDGRVRADEILSRFSKWERRFALASIETLTLARLRRLQGAISMRV